jgi:hypothetical protein
VFGGDDAQRKWICGSRGSLARNSGNPDGIFLEPRVCMPPSGSTNTTDPLSDPRAAVRRTAMKWTSGGADKLPVEL